MPSASNLMTPRYGIDTSVFVLLLTGDPEEAYLKTVEQFEKRLEHEPNSEFVVSNQVIGEAYIALQHHYEVSKSDAKSAMLSVLQSGLCTPMNGAAVLEALKANRGCGLLDRLILNDYDAQGVKALTSDLRMSRLPGAERL